MLTSRRHILPFARLILCIAVLIGTTPGSIAWAVDTTWILNGNGNWTIAGNWDNGEPTNNTFNVFIDDGDTAVVVTLNANRTIGNLAIGANDALDVSNGLDLQIDGSTLANSGMLTITSAGNDTGLRIEGTTTVSGGGQIVLAGTGNSLIRDQIAASDGHLINVDNIIRGRGSLGVGRLQITNQAAGTIRADVSGQTLLVDPDADGMINQGIMEAVVGGFVVLAGGDYANAGGTIRANGVGSLVRLNGNAHITGGTLSTDADGVIQTNGGLSILENLTINGKVRVNSNDILELRGTITNQGNTIELNGGGNTTDLLIEGDVTLAGGGDVHMIGAFSRILDAFAAPEGHLSNQDNRIHGRGQVGGDGGRMLVTNGGIIEADAGAVNGPLSVRGRGGDAGGHPGVINTATGIFRASNNSTLDLSGSGNGNFTNSGTFESVGDGSVIQTNNSAQLTNLAAGVLTGGTYRVVSPNGATNTTTILFTTPNSAINTIAANTTVEMSGSEARTVFNSGAQPLNVSLATNSGTLKLLNGQAFNMTNALTNNGEVELGGVGLNGGTLNSGGNITNNAAAVIIGHGTISDTVLNHGTVVAANGTLAVVGGIIDGQSGTIQIDPGATLDLSGASGDSDTDNLIHNGAGLNLGANDVLVKAQYANANFGIGNSFNPRANVTGAGQILSEPALQQHLAGDVAGGTTATPTLNMGVVRIGQPGSTKSYNVAIIGPGPVVTGAVMNNNATFGASITNPQLSGSGVSASDFSIAPGSSLGYTVNLVGQAGGQGALTGQTVGIVNNFDNVAEQVLAINGEVWQPAVPIITPAGPVNMGNFHVGDAASQQLSIANNAVVSAFSESLKATVTSNGAPVLVSGGPSVTVAPGITDISMGVGIDTTTGGAKSGGVTITRFSSGATGLADLNLGNQEISFSAGVYRFASPVVNNLNLGDRHVGDAASGNVAVQNNAINDAFSEALRVSVAGTAPDVTGATGTADIAPGAGSGTNLSASLSTATAGDKSGTVTYDLTSVAHASGLTDTPLGTAQATVTAKVYNFAVGQVTSPQPVNFGIVHVGEAVPSRLLTIKNNAAAGAFSENLDVATGTHGAGITGGGTINDLAPQASNNSALGVGISTATAGAISGNYVVTLMSDGTGINSLGQTPLANLNVPVTAQVNNFAVAQLLKLTGNGSLLSTGPNTFTLDLGTTVQDSADLLAELGVKNNAPGLPSDDLAGVFALPPSMAFTITGFGAFNGLGGGATRDDLFVGLDLGTVGTFSGQIVLNPQSTNPQPFSMDLPAITINLLGQVTPVPEPAGLALLMLGLGCIAACRRRR